MLKTFLGEKKKDAVELFSSQSTANDCRVGSVVPGGEGPSSKCWLIVMIISYSQDCCEAQMGHCMRRHAADTTRQRWRYSVNGPRKLEVYAFHFHTLREGREAWEITDA